MNKLFRSTVGFLDRNASTILTCIGGAGVIATSIIAVKATPTALTRLEEAEKAKGEDLTNLEKVQVAGPVYIPAIAVGVSTIACIFGANILSKRSQASMVSAYALLDSSYRDYKKKVDELYGEEAGAQIRSSIAQDKYEEEDAPTDDNKQLFFDYFSGRYFESTIEDVQRAEYRINRDLVMRDGVYLNEFYEHLGIEPIEAGNELGWSVGGNEARYWQSWVDFDHEKTIVGDDLECYIIRMQSEPFLGFDDYA